MKLVKNNCPSNRCAAKVKSTSKRTDNQGLARIHLNKLRKRNGFKKPFFSGRNNASAAPGKKKKWKDFLRHSSKRPSDVD